MWDATSAVWEIIISIIGRECQSYMWCEKSPRMYETQRTSKEASIYCLPQICGTDFVWQDSSMNCKRIYLPPSLSWRGLLKLKVPKPVLLRHPDINVKITENTIWGWTDLTLSKNYRREAICHFNLWPNGTWNQYCEHIPWCLYLKAKESRKPADIDHLL